MDYLTSEEVRDILVISFPMTTIVDSVSVQAIAEEVVFKMEGSDLRRLILDFTGVSFVSSELAGVLVNLRRYCHVQGVSLKLAGLSSGFREVLELTNLSTLFKIYRTRNSAIEMFGADDFIVRHEFFENYANFGTDDLSDSAPVPVAPLRLTLEPETSAFRF